MYKNFTLNTSINRKIRKKNGRWQKIAMQILLISPEKHFFMLEISFLCVQKRQRQIEDKGQED